MPRLPRAGGYPMNYLRALPLVLLLAGCAGQQHPTSLSGRVQCQLGLIGEAIRAIPDDAIYGALMGEPERLNSYLVQAGMSPERIVEFHNAWKACNSPPE